MAQLLRNIATKRIYAANDRSNFFTRLRIVERVLIFSGVMFCSKSSNLIRSVYSIIIRLFNESDSTTMSSVNMF